MNEIPTPETTFRYEADKYTGGFSAYENMRDHAIDLERRLTVARKALVYASTTLITMKANSSVVKTIMDETFRQINQALTLTTPKL